MVSKRTKLGKYQYHPLILISDKNDIRICVILTNNKVIIILYKLQQN